MDELLEMLLLLSVGVGEEGGGVIHREVEDILLFRGMAEEAALSSWPVVVIRRREEDGGPVLVVGESCY